jgi:hypothetical protein
MPQHPFPDPGQDGEEPDGSPLPPAAEGTGPEDNWEGSDEEGIVRFPQRNGLATRTPP